MKGLQVTRKMSVKVSVELHFLPLSVPRYAASLENIKISGHGMEPGNSKAKSISFFFFINCLQYLCY